VLGDFVSNAVAKADASARGAREPSAHSVTGARAVPDWGAALARGGPRTRVRQSAGVISSPIHEVSVTRMSDVAQLRAVPARLECVRDAACLAGESWLAEWGALASRE